MQKDGWKKRLHEWFAWKRCWLLHDGCMKQWSLDPTTHLGIWRCEKCGNERRDFDMHGWMGWVHDPWDMLRR